MLQKRRSEVLVVGAGPVGLAATVLLADKHIGVRIIDREWRAATRGQAIMLHPHSIALLERMGIAAETLHSAARVDRIVYYEGAQRRAEVKFDQLEGPHPYAAVMRQDVLEDILRRKLHQQRVGVEWSHALSSIQPSEEQVDVTIDRWGREARGYAVVASERVVESTSHDAAAFVIGADGHNSTVRRMLDIDTVAVGDARLFAVFEFRGDVQLSAEARVVVGDGIGGALWPLPGGWFRWSFRVDEAFVNRLLRRDQLAVQIGGEFYPHLDREELMALIAEHAPWFKSTVDEIRWSMAVRFERRVARDFGSGRCWLTGDAAHLSGPIAVQSVNRGFIEVEELAGRIATILRDGGPIRSLADYNQRHTAEWRRILRLENQIASDTTASDWVKKHADRVLSCIPASGETLGALAKQLGLEVAAR